MKIKDFDIIDKRCDKPFIHNLQFIGHLRAGEVINGVCTPNQEEIVETFCNSPMGFIIAPPRTGKSVIGVAIAVRLRVKTIIIANQIDLLQNFMKSFERDTNLLELQKESKQPIVKLLESPKDYKEFLEHPEQYDIILTTYQRFIRSTENLSKEQKQKTLEDHFGLFIVDEVHMAGATEFLKFIYSLDCKYRLGLTATPLRKDGLDALTSKIVGPIVYQAQNLSLIPELQVKYTKVKIETSKLPGNAGFAVYLNRVFNNIKRHNIILEDVFKDLKEHQCIIIPMERVKAETKLMNDINERAKKEGLILPGQKICEMFSGSSSDHQRKQVLKNIEDGVTRVVVATMAIMKQGIDMSIPTMLYVLSPLAARKGEDALIGSPKFFQLANRVCTPRSNKKQPVVRLYVDDSGISRSCLISLWKYEIKPGLKENNHRSKDPIYKINDSFLQDLHDSMVNDYWSQQSLGIKKQKSLF